jgi:hypothetical protein
MSLLTPRHQLAALAVFVTVTSLVPDLHSGTPNGNDRLKALRFVEDELH